MLEKAPFWDIFVKICNKVQLQNIECKEKYDYFNYHISLVSIVSVAIIQFMKQITAVSKKFSFQNSKVVENIFHGNTVNHGRRKIHEYFLLLLCKSSTWFTENTFSKLPYISLIHQNVPQICHFIWGIWWFHRSKDFEVMKAGKSAIWHWLVCQYNENTLVDLPSSVGKLHFSICKGC